jgi:hypothetical protein
MGLSNSGSASAGRPWPPLPFAEWKDTCATLHMWSQIVGKIRTVQSAPVNHSWHVPLYVTARGLTTSAIPYGTGIFDIELDFVDHLVRIRTGEGTTRTVALRPRAVADFYRDLFRQLTDLGMAIGIHARPNEVAEAIPFDEDEVHRSYDAAYANRFWRVLSQADRVFKQFRAGFIGKCSPVHFFWGSFDLASTRFSGAAAPLHPGGVPNCPDWVTREAYSHEVSSCGFWPGNETLPVPLFYSYAYPEPPGFRDAKVAPDEARYDSAIGEFVLPYDAVWQADDPDRVLLAFLDSSYAAAADLGHWNRHALERQGALAGGFMRQGGSMTGGEGRGVA